MAGGTALVATHRITVSYADASQVHVIRAYCKPANMSATPPTIHHRNGSTTFSWVLAAQHLFSMIANILDNDFSPGGALLEENVVGTDTWTVVDTASLTGTGALGSGTLPASQYTLVVRDTEFRKIRVVVLDTAKHYTGHSASGLGIDTDTDTVANEYNGANASDDDSPYNWQVSRKNLFVKAVGAVAGGTYDLNDRVKRDRGLE